MPDKVIELSDHLPTTDPDRSLLQRFERTLPAGDPVKQIHEIMDRDDAEGYIQSLNPHTLYRLVKEAGWDQGADLIPYATPWQIQIFMDLDIWQGDRLLPKKMELWLSTLITDASDTQFQRVVRELDSEVLALYFKANMKVELIEDDEIPDHLEGNVSLSPDNSYALVYPEDEDTAAILRALIDRLYELDFALAWTLLEAVRWELVSEMEEMAFHWRNSRLEEFGFVKREEAFAVYQYLNPITYRERVEARETTPKARSKAPKEIDLPTVLESTVGGDFYFSKILERVHSDNTVRELVYELAVLTNKTMIADGIEPGELESGHEVARRTLGYLSLGLEFLSRSDDEVALELIETLSLKNVFQTGYSLTRKLQLNVASLAKRPVLSLIEGAPFSLLNEDDEALCQALSRPRPSFAWNALEHDIFRTQEQVDSAALRIGMLAFKQLWVFGIQGQTVDTLAALAYGDNLINDPNDVTFDTLFTTAVATFLASGTPELRGITLEELENLPPILTQRPWAEDMVGYFEALIGPILVSLPAGSARLATRWLKETLDTLREELADVTEIVEPEFFQNVLLIAFPE